jgi:hypothetical protein
MWCRLMCVLVWHHNPSYVLRRCSHVRASGLMAARHSAACVAMAVVTELV